MSHFVLTKTVLRQGVWQGVLTAKDGADAPQITVSHQGTELAEVTLTAAEATGEWHLSIPIPAEVIADGVQTLLITEQTSGAQLGHVLAAPHLLGQVDEALGDDIRAEMDLLRAELDMLKRAFRRHCRETA